MKNISPYIPSIFRNTIDNNRKKEVSLIDFINSNISNTSSFEYDAQDVSLKNTQQLNVDWSEFKNHVFFSSAESKVGMAVDQIVNNYPFDGSLEEVENFFENIGGFENWVFNQFPKYKGFLHFNSSLQNWIEVKDFEGAVFPELAKKNSGKSVLNPNEGNSFSSELHLFIPQNSSSKQVVFQKRVNDTNNIGLYIDSTYSLSESEVIFLVISGSSYLETKTTVPKNSFNQICSIWNRENSLSFSQIYVNSELKNESQNRIKFGDIDLQLSSLTIGSGSSVSYNGITFTPTQTLSGSLDEFRLFHSVRSKETQELFQKKAIFSTPDLKLYYKFNEPTNLSNNISDPINSIVLDYSSNSLHAFVNNFNSSLRRAVSSEPTSLMMFEKDLFSPVLFPAYLEVQNLVSTLMTEASIYDQENPNLITKLIPRHYLVDSSIKESSDEPLNPDKIGSYNGNGIPGQGEFNSAQIIVSFLYVWAKFFDEIKIYLDTFSNLKYVNYDKTDTIPDNFLLKTIRTFGLNILPFFNNSSIEQFVKGENIEEYISNSEKSLKQVQNDLMRRVLINMPDILKSKGTQHSIKSFLRSLGIDPDNTFKIREFGGPTVKNLDFSREIKIDTSVMLNMSNPTSVLYSTFLSGSRSEPGYPQIKGSLSNPLGVSDENIDGFFTSGSWTFEGIYKLNENIVTQSLARLCHSEFSVDNPWESSLELDDSLLVSNLVFINDLNNPRLRLHLRPGYRNDSPYHLIELPVNKKAFSKSEKWNVSFGCIRNDQINSAVSSSYFIKAGLQEEGTITQYFSKESFFQETTNLLDNNVFREDTPTTFGSNKIFLSLGENQFIDSTKLKALNNVLLTEEDARTTSFSGRVSNVKFWSKAISDDEFKEHIRNYKSTGVDNAKKNWNYVTNVSGSFEKLRLNAIQKQENFSSNNLGEISLLDFSENNIHLSGSGFNPDERILEGETFFYSYLSPYFDESSFDEKIRIRGYSSFENAREKSWAGISPVNEIVASERPNDDARLSIEFSLVDSLNKDIITLFSSFEELENAIGDPNLIYSPDYPDLEILRDVYFNRIKDKLNFQKFFDFYRWFDNSLGDFVSQIIPRKTNFKGVNFTIESHMLERNKMEYKVPDFYLSDEERSRIKDSLFLQQITGILKKF